MRIIAFGHRMGVGKSTATRFLIGELRIRNKGIHVVQAAFADKLKNVAWQLFGWGGLQPGHYYEEHYDQKNVILPALGRSPRDLWIDVGNGIRTAYGGVWLQYLLNTTVADVLVISDLRFPNEAEGIKAAGGTIHRIDRDSQAKVTDGADDPLEDYQGWNSIIKNNGSLGDLHTAIMELI